MLQAKSLELARLPNATRFQLGTEVRDLVAKSGAEALKIAPEAAAYNAAYTRLDDAYQKVSKSAISLQLIDADKERDDIFNGLTLAYRAAAVHYEENVRKAAARIAPLFGTYGNVARMAYNDQTAATTNLLQELTGQYAADVTTMGLGGWVATLDAKNKAFDTLMKERFDETAAKTGIAMKTARAELDDAHRAVVTKINALVVVEGAANYETFIKTLNAVIAKYEAIINARKGRGGKKGGGADVGDDNGDTDLGGSGDE